MQVSASASQPPKSGRWLPWTAAAATLLAVALAVAAIAWETRGTAESKAYVREPLYGVWGGLILLQMGVAAALGLASFNWWRELRHLEPPPPQGRRHAIRDWLVAGVVLGAALLVPAFAMPTSYPRNYPDHQNWRVLALAAYAVAAMAVTAAALVRLREVAKVLPSQGAGAAERFRFLWGRQRQLLGALAAMLAVNVLATAVKYQMNNDFEVPAGSTVKELPDLPATYVLVIGAIYGAVILAVYLPVYLATRQAGEQLATRLAGVESATDEESWFAAHTNRERYRSALGVAEGTREHLERAAGLLAPLMAALFAAVLPELKL
jgi:hypothetical protein